MALSLAGMTVIPGVCKAQNNDSFVEVNASAEKEVAPDVFYLRVDIREEDSKGKKTLEQQQKSLLSLLRSMNVNTETQLSRLSLSSAYNTRRNNYAQATYQVKLFDSDTLFKLWQKLDDAGFSSVSFVKAECSTLEQVKDEVRKMAVVNARNQARSMAQAIGQDIGRCFWINGGYASSPVVYAQPRMMMKSNAMDGAMAEEQETDTVLFSNVKVTANVSAKFVLE